MQWAKTCFLISVPCLILCFGALISELLFHCDIILPKEARCDMATSPVQFRLSPKSTDCVKWTQLEIKRHRNLQHDRDIHCELHPRCIGNESCIHRYCRFYRIGEAKNPGPPHSDCRICVYNPTGMNNKHMFFLEHLQNGISWFQKPIDD